MPDDEWITTLADGRKVKFTNQELLEDRAFITAQVAGNKVVYSIVLAKIRIPPGREEVESYFEDGAFQEVAMSDQRWKKSVTAKACFCELLL